MRVFNTAAPPPAAKAVPFDVYASLVGSLFDDRRSLMIGSVAAAACVVLAAIKTGNLVLAVFAGTIAVVAAMRMVDMQAYHRARSSLTTAEAVRRWEISYVVGSTVQVALLGFSCLTAFLVSSDPFVHLLSFGITLAYIVGTSGRNFASPLLVYAQMLGAVLPLTVAMVAMGGWYFTIFAFILLPLFVALKFISDRLRSVLLDAVIANRDLTKLNTLFD